MEALQKPWDIDLSLYDSEEELLGGLRRRDLMACTCLLKRFAPRLYRLALQITGSADDAEDALQEAFISACNRIDSFEAQGGSSLGTWLYRIVLNSSLMHLRKRKPGVMSIERQGDGASGLQGAAPLDLEDPGRSPGEHVLSSELRERIDEAILHLPDSLRAAFVLRDVEGLSTAEAAVALGIGEAALKVRLHRARLQLREALTPYLLGESAQESEA